ncbi:MAG: hypothetical protein JRI25_02695 [Deltaproteobacteria bacterium]|nr:hypothetical protein [Deltaproteobacteria bacterium]
MTRAHFGHRVVIEGATYAAAPRPWPWPLEMGDDDVLIRVRSTSVNTPDRVQDRAPGRGFQGDPAPSWGPGCRL